MSTPSPLREQREAMVDALLRWFAEAARPLPWREERTPYRVWVAEVMLQQTQVEKVKRYYAAFLRRFPTVEALAAAPLEAVLKAWEGLGYYRRARALHRAAQTIVAEYGGRLPDEVSALRRLPGVGAYTAGAVASIAFGQAAPAVDGNVRRVMARVLAHPAPPRAEIEEAVSLLLPADEAGTFNEALMELGATVCRPRHPQCRRCPWRPFCRAHREGAPEQYPAPKGRPALPHYDVVAAVIIGEEGRVLLAQRRAEDMLGGLWEFPGGKREADETREAALRRELLEEMAIHIEVGEPLIEMEHAYTHFRITLTAFRARLVAGEVRCLECDAFLWADEADLERLPMSVTDRRIATLVAPLLGTRLTAGEGRATSPT